MLGASLLVEGHLGRVTSMTLVIAKKAGITILWLVFLFD